MTAVYGWLWRSLPGPFGVRLVLAVALLAAVVAALFFVVFPWIGPMLPFEQVDVG